jgi:predicted RNA-binding Zn-ribbon protein involved in translation (DUF1610 family)
LFEMIISDINQISTMTMNCPSCGTLMIWLNGSIMHDQQINFYECRNCKIKLNTLSDGSYEITQQDSEHQLE